MLKYRIMKQDYSRRDKVKEERETNVDGDKGPFDYN